MKNIPETKGHKKLARYIKDLIRNKPFLKDLKRLKKYENKREPVPQLYVDRTPEQQKESDDFNKEITSIINGYELLRKRTEKLFDSRQLRKRMYIAEKYGLNTKLLGYAQTMLESEEKAQEYDEFYWLELEMCQIESPHDEEISPANPGEEIIHLKPHRQIHLNAYPISIGIHVGATKRDVLDFIEKRWKWIENNIRIHKDKALQNRQRKHSQTLLDFIWKNRNVPARELKKLIDTDFPENGLVYYEIQEIIRQEKKRRTQELT